MKSTQFFIAKYLISSRKRGKATAAIESLFAGRVF